MYEKELKGSQKGSRADTVADRGQAGNRLKIL